MISTARIEVLKNYLKFLRYQFSIMIGYQAWIFLIILYIYSLVTLLFEFVIFGGEKAIYTYINAVPFSIFAILVCMHLIPKERESGTLETLFTNPFFFKIISLKVALVLIVIVVSEFVLNMIYFFVAGSFNIPLMIFNSLFPILLMIAITIYFSLFIKNPNAAGMISFVITVIFYRWIFFSPYTNDPFVDPIEYLWKSIFNRSLLLILTIMFFIYTWRRLRSTEKILL